METKYLEAIDIDARSEEHAVVRQLRIDPDIARAEHLLAEAGIGFTEVERCPVANCEVCEPVELDAAA